MADFCTKCSEEMGFPYPDIDENDLFSKLQPNQYFPVLCEGCAMLAVAKGFNGEMLLGYPSETDSEMMVWESKHRKPI